MKTYTYPAILTEYGEGKEISVVFPDFDVATSGKDKVEAIQSAKECLNLVIGGFIADGNILPKPTELEKVRTENNERVIIVSINI